MYKSLLLLISLVISTITTVSQNATQLDIEENFYGKPKKVIEAFYSKKQHDNKFIQIDIKTTPFPKVAYNITHSVTLIELTSCPQILTLQLFDSSKTQCVDMFNKDGTKLGSYYFKKVADSVLSDTLFKISNLFDKSGKKNGTKMINVEKKTEWQQNYQYNNRGLLSRVILLEKGTAPIVIIKFDYTAFDKKGNWITRKETTTLKDRAIARTCVTKRLITYY